jgi:hypothetical protein
MSLKYMGELMKLYSTALLISVAVLVSCAPVRPIINDLPTPPQRSVHNGFSLLPLDETGWKIGAQQPNMLVLGKQGGNPDESFIIRAFTVVLPEFKSRDEFMGFAKTAIGEFDPVRFKRLSDEAKSKTVKGQSCGRTKSMMEDHGAVKRTNRPDFMVIEAYSVVCPHPQKRIAVVIAYSHRYYPGNADLQSEKKADKIFETVEFINF